jgi:hypothetical protein
MVYHSDMKLANSMQDRWVIQKVDQRTVRCTKELAIRHGVRIADIVETAIYQLYANQDRLKGFKPPTWSSRDN